jgi:hypothetical protein
LEVQYNPKEIQLDKSIAWQHQPGHVATDLEYTGGESSTMQFELLLDGFETGTPIQPDVDKLDTLSSVDATLKRPPKVKVSWGQEGVAGQMPKFEGVIEQFIVKYVMFNSSGKPLRATVGLKLKEARNLAVGKPG